jgi:hypothetical protein
MADPRRRLLEAFERVPERHRDTIAAAVAAVADAGPREGAAQVVELLLGLDARGWPKAKPRRAQVIDLAEWRRSREREAGNS